MQLRPKWRVNNNQDKINKKHSTKRVIMSKNNPPKTIRMTSSSSLLMRMASKNHLKLKNSNHLLSLLRRWLAQEKCQRSPM